MKVFLSLVFFALFCFSANADGHGIPGKIVSLLNQNVAALKSLSNDTARFERIELLVMEYVQKIQYDGQEDSITVILPNENNKFGFTGPAHIKSQFILTVPLQNLPNCKKQILELFNMTISHFNNFWQPFVKNYLYRANYTFCQNPNKLKFTGDKENNKEVQCFARLFTKIYTGLDLEFAFAGTFNFDDYYYANFKGTELKTYVLFCVDSANDKNGNNALRKGVQFILDDNKNCPNLTCNNIKQYMRELSGCSDVFTERFIAATCGG